MEGSMPVFWLALFVILGILEAVTTQLVTIWFAVGALFALGAAAFHAPIWLQCVLFVLVSVCALVLTRPIVRKHLNSRKVPTNADRVIGRSGTVLQTIDNLHSEGTVSVDGTVWTARSEDGSVIEAGTQVIAQRIEGVKLIVKQKESA